MAAVSDPVNAQVESPVYGGDGFIVVLRPQVNSQLAPPMAQAPKPIGVSCRFGVAESAKGGRGGLCHSNRLDDFSCLNVAKKRAQTTVPSRLFRDDRLLPSAVLMLLSVILQFRALAIVPALGGLNLQMVEAEVIQRRVGIGADVKGAPGAGSLDIPDVNTAEVRQSLLL